MCKALKELARDVTCKFKVTKMCLLLLVLVELSLDEFSEIVKSANKHKRKVNFDESLPRRSNRIAHLHMGFKDQTSATAASENISKLQENKNDLPGCRAHAKNKSDVAMNQGAIFDAIIINNASPPPHISMCIQFKPLELALAR